VNFFIAQNMWKAVFPKCWLTRISDFIYIVQWQQKLKRIWIDDQSFISESGICKSWLALPPALPQ